jgi:hypothetical protein
MIVGGFAVYFHGRVRATEDLDLFVNNTEDNARRVTAALRELSRGEDEYSPEMITKGKGVLIGTAPLKVDILAQIAGVRFEDAWKRKRTDQFGPATVNFIGREDLIANKKAAGRPKDLEDARVLEGGER